MLTIIDMDAGNLGSVVRAFEHVGASVAVTASPEAVNAATALVLPGVGSFGDAMRSLAARGLVGSIRRAVLERKRPLLGICVGMQVLATRGMEFGVHEGLGLVPGQVRPLAPYPGCRIPNMGWCDVSGTRDDGIVPAAPQGQTYYFAHSYHFACDDPTHVVATMDWGGQPVAAAVQHGTVAGVQFHPEKSQDAGLELLYAFWLAASMRGEN